MNYLACTAMILLDSWDVMRETLVRKKYAIYVRISYHQEKHD